MNIVINSCGGDPTLYVPHSGSSRYVEYTSNLDVYYCYYPGSNTYRPLGNNPFPLGHSDMRNFFSGLNLSGVTLTQKFSPIIDLQAMNFDVLDFDNLRSLIKNYEQVNSVGLNREYNKILFFSITRDRDIYSPYGIAYGLKEFITDTLGTEIRLNQPFAITQVGKIDSFYKAYGGLNDDQRKKLIERNSIHEIVHSRGFVDGDNAPLPYWEVHCNHAALDSGKCVMYWTAGIYNNINNMYPPKFCGYHKKVFNDSLYDRFVADIDIPPPNSYAIPITSCP